jgi:iron complex outermembrane recepter protein
MKALAYAMILFLGSASTLAQDLVIEEIIVTATKRSESLQDIPMAVNAFTRDTIQEAGIDNAGDLANLTPSFSVSVNASPFDTRFAIRGIGTAQNDPALEPSVGIFVDGIFLGRTGLGMSDLTDIERIEVLQGPQGTLYGKNTNAGAISVITPPPNLERAEGFVEASTGNYNLAKFTAAASGPLGDTVAYRLSGSVHRRDGFYDNLGGEDLDAADDWNLQAKLLWEPTDSLSFLLSGAHVNRDSHCCAADSTQGQAVRNELDFRGLPPEQNDPYDYQIATDVDSEFKMESDLVSLHIDYAAAWGDVKSMTAWNDYHYTTDGDVDRSQLDILSTLNTYGGGDSYSQELRLDTGLGNNIDFMIGLFYYDQETQRGDRGGVALLGEDFVLIADQQDLSLPFPTLALIAQPGDFLTGENTWNNETFALFGQATWHVGARWHLTGGLRWTDERREARLFSINESTAPLAPEITFLNSVSTPIDAKLKRSNDNVDWLLRAAFDIGDYSMVYASAATGTKSGNFNGVNGTPDEREFDDEHTLSYELGLKSTVLNARLRVNAAAFYTIIDDYQSQQQLPTGIGTMVGNQAEVKVSGVDLQLDAVPLPNLTLTAGLLYMHDYEFTAGARDGNPLPLTAEFRGNLGATLALPLGDGMVYLRGDYIFMDEHTTSGIPSEQLRDKDFDDRNVLNAKLGWRNEHWNLSVWGKNLTEDDYATFTSQTQFFSGQDSYFLAPPRTYGATLRYDL